MADFTMTGYYHQYQDAVTKRDQIRRQIESLKSALASGFGGEDTFEELQAAEEAYKAAQAEADDLHCLATYGKHRAELDQSRGVKHTSLIGGLQPTPHFPETPRGGRLPH